MLKLYSQSMYLVTIGTIIGHSVCTAGAVIAGRYISTKVDVKYGTGCFTLLFSTGSTHARSDTLRSCIVHPIRIHLHLRVLCRHLWAADPKRYNAELMESVYICLLCRYNILHPRVVILPTLSWDVVWGTTSVGLEG